MHGENLFNAALIIDKAGQEIDAMLEKLFCLLQEEPGLKDFIRKVEHLNYDPDETNEWVRLGTLENFGLYNKRAISKVTAWLAVQIKLYDEREEEIVREPLVYVLLSSKREKREWDYNKFLLSDVKTSSSWKLNSGCLWERFDEDEDRSSERPWYKAEWAFVVPLVSLNTPNDLQESIVNPVRALIEGKSTKEAFVHSEKVLQFSVGDDNSVISIQGD